jgi:hypothetical protein
MDWVWQNADKIGGLAGALSSIIALIAVLFAVWQIAVSRSTAHEINAIQAYQLYLKACVEKPKFGSWEIFCKFSEGSFKKPYELFGERASEESEAYLWHVTEMLRMCELVLTVTREKHMKKSITSQIEWHDEVIIELWKKRGWGGDFSKELTGLLEKTIPSIKSLKSK